ncbi:MAG: caspase family protein [Planctomycetota bacterium]|nr:caspase family protein [Planctomycetota bacterium]
MKLHLSFKVALLIVAIAEPLNAATWAIVIGVDNYSKLSSQDQLKYCGADALRMARTLVESNNIRDDRLLRVFVQRAVGIERPTREVLRKRIPEILSQVQADDDVIFYFSGHGFLGGDGHSYLAPQDCDPLRLGQTGIQVQWIHDQLQQCAARRRIVFLDACYAGNENEWATVTDGLNRMSTQAYLQNRPAFYSIVSCDGQQRSLEWPAKRHGVFTYWLTRGMEGAADADGDAHVSLDELFNFVQARVPETAQMLCRSSTNPKQFAQKPVRFMGGNALENPKLTLRAESATLALERLADLVDDLLRHNRGDGRIATQVGIIEFANQTGDEVVLRGPLGSLGQLVAQRIESRLRELSSSDAYAVRDRSETTDLLARADRPFGVKDLKVQKRLLELSARGNAPDILLAGVMRRLSAPDRLVLSCRLIELKSGTTVGQATVTLVIDADLWPLLGGSVDMAAVTKLPMKQPSQKPRREPERDEPTIVRPAVPEIVNRLNRLSQGRHPLLPGQDPTCVKLVVYRIRNGQRQAVSLLPLDPSDESRIGFALQQGDEFELVLQNVHPGEERLAAVVLVDGLNVLSPLTKGVAANRVRPPEVLELVREARSWLLPSGSTLKIDGWLFPRTSKNAARFEFDRYRFRATALGDSLAGQSGFLDQVGQITIAVFGHRELPRGARAAGGGPIGIGAGEFGSRDFSVIRDWTINRQDLKAVYTIHYHQER